MTRKWLRWMPAVAVPAVIAAGVLAGSLPASAGDPLPAKTPQQVLLMIAQHGEKSLSGTLEQSSELGLPELPKTGPGAGSAGDRLAGAADRPAHRPGLPRRAGERPGPGDGPAGRAQRRPERQRALVLQLQGQHGRPRPAPCRAGEPPRRPGPEPCRRRRNWPTSCSPKLDAEHRRDRRCRMSRSPDGQPTTSCSRQSPTATLVDPSPSRLTAKAGCRSASN